MPSRAFFQFCRSTSLVCITGLTAGMVVSLGGCDAVDRSSAKGDKQVDAHVTAADEARDQSSAMKELDAAAKVKEASVIEQMRAQALLANGELKEGQRLIGQVAVREAMIDRIGTEITGLVEQVRSNNAAVAALQKLVPDKIQDSIKQQTGDITGAEDKPEWYKSPSGVLASQVANDKEAAGLQSQITQLQDAIKSETDQRTTLLNDADKLNDQSEREKAQKSVDLYTQGSEKRKQAAELSIKLDQDNVTLARAQSDLALHQAVHESTQTSIKGLSDRSTVTDERWKAVQDQIAKVNDASKTLLGDENSTATPIAGRAKDDPGTGDTISSKAAALAQLVKVNKTDRALAMTHFEAAAGLYGEAVKRADSFASEMSQRPSFSDSTKPEYEVWQAQKKALNSANFRIAQADAQLQIANAQAREALETKTRVDLANLLKPVVDEAKLTAPPSLADDLTENLKEIQNRALKNYNGATESFSKIIEGGGAEPDNRLAAQVEVIFAHYGWSQMATMMGDASVADTQLGLARSAVTAAQSSNAFLPPLPADLATSAPAASGGLK